jgi:hypothetical protein
MIGLGYVFKCLAMSTLSPRNELNQVKLWTYNDTGQNETSLEGLYRESVQTVQSLLATDNEYLM